MRFENSVCYGSKNVRVFDGLCLVVAFDVDFRILFEFFFIFTLVVGNRSNSNSEM
jgi:hypothetical protein